VGRLLSRGPLHHQSVTTYFADRCRRWSTCSGGDPQRGYGFWGVFALIRTRADRSRIDVGEGIPVIGWLFEGAIFRYSVFAAAWSSNHGVAHRHAICPEVFDTAPVDEKEAALAVGAAKWEMLAHRGVPAVAIGDVGAGDPGTGPPFGKRSPSPCYRQNVLAIPTGYAPGIHHGQRHPNEFAEANQPFHLDSLCRRLRGCFVVLVVNIMRQRVVGRVSEPTSHEGMIIDTRTTQGSARATVFPGSRRRQSSTAMHACCTGHDGHRRACWCGCWPTSPDRD